MRWQLFSLALVASLSESCCAQDREVREAVRSALNWHYRWMEALPREPASIDCSVALFTQQSFALCEPLSLALNVETRERGRPRVTFIGNETSSFDVAEAAFRRNVNPKGRFVGPVRKFSFTVRDLGGCTVDSKLSAHAPSVVLTREVRTALLSSGHSFRYPVVCEGDPFYLLYCLTGKKILWIWQYEINGDGLELRWSFDAGTQQRRPPTQAIENLNKNELWYRTEIEE